MSNKIVKSVSLNRGNAEDLRIIEKIAKEGFNFNGWVRGLMIEDMNRVRVKGTGIKHIVR